MKKLAAALLMYLLLLLPIWSVVHNIENIKKEIGITENLGKTIDTSLTFTNQDGEIVALSEFFHKKKPVIISPVYYSCSRLCTFILNGLSSAVKKQESLLPGRDYTILTISINPLDTTSMTAQKRMNYFKSMGAEVNANSRLKEGWQFFTGKQENIKLLMAQLGFRYRKSNTDFEHSAAVMVLTPEGKIARYLYGIQYRHSDFKLALIEAAAGNIGSVMNRLILYCFQFDPTKRHYSLIAWNVMKIGASAFAVTTLGLLGFLWLPSSRKKKEKIKNKQDITS